MKLYFFLLLFLIPVVGIAQCPVITKQPENQTDCDGNSIRMISIASPGATYQWERKKPTDTQFSEIAGASTSSYQAAITGDVNNPTGSIYRTKITLNKCVIYTNSAEITLNKIGPIINPSICERGLGILEPQLNETSTANAKSYQWSRSVAGGPFTDLSDDSNFKGTTDKNLTIRQASMILAGQKLKVRILFSISPNNDNEGSITNENQTTNCPRTSTEIIIQIKSSPIPVHSASVYKGCLGGSIGINSTGCSPYVTQWYDSNEKLIGSGAKLIVTQTDLNPKMFRATCLKLGCESLPSTGTSAQAFSIPLAPTNTSVPIVCSGSTITFKASGGTYNIWYLNEKDLNSISTATSISVIPPINLGLTNVPILRWASQKINECEGPKAAISVQNPPKLKVIAGASGNIFGSSLYETQSYVTAEGGNAPYQYTWENLAGKLVTNNISNPSVGPFNQSGLVKLKVSDARNCVSRDSVYITWNATDPSKAVSPTEVPVKPISPIISKLEPIIPTVIPTALNPIAPVTVVPITPITTPTVAPIIPTVIPTAPFPSNLNPIAPVTVVPAPITTPTAEPIISTRPNAPHVALTPTSNPTETILVITQPEEIPLDSIITKPIVQPILPDEPKVLPIIPMEPPIIIKIILEAEVTKLCSSQSYKIVVKGCSSPIKYMNLNNEDLGFGETFFLQVLDDFSIVAKCETEYSDPFYFSLEGLRRPSIEIKKNYDQFICEKELVELSLNIPPNSDFINWEKDGHPFSENRVMKDLAEHSYFQATIRKAECIYRSEIIEIDVHMYPNTPHMILSANSVCLNDRVLVSVAEDATFYKWENESSAKSYFHQASEVGDFTFKAKLSFDQMCWSNWSKPVHLRVNPTPKTPDILTFKNAGFCNGDSTLIQTSGYAMAWLWSNNIKSKEFYSKNPETFKVQIQDSLGCWSLPSKSVSSFHFPIQKQPNLKAFPTNQFCSGKSIILKTNLAFDYLWNTGEKNDSIIVSKTGKYWLKTKNEFGCWSKNSTPELVFERSTPQTPNIEKAGTYFIKAFNFDPVDRYEWRLGVHNFSDSTDLLKLNRNGIHEVRAKKVYYLLESQTIACYSEYKKMAFSIPESFDGLSVYPNPTVNTSISVEVLKNISNGEIRLFNLNGYEVVNWQIQNTMNQIQLDLSHIPNGEYILKFMSDAWEAEKLLFIFH